jgi:hypothetical protein
MSDLFMSDSLRSHDATAIPLERSPTTNTTTSAGVSHQLAPEKSHHPPDWPMAAELQRPATGDGTRQAGGVLSFEPTRVTVGARAARRSWLPSPGKRPLRGPFQTEMACWDSGNPRKDGRWPRCHAISFCVSGFIFLRNRTPPVPGGVLLRIATPDAGSVWFGGAGLDVIDRCCVSDRGEGALCWVSLRGYTWKSRTICRLVSCESPDRVAIFWTALLSAREISGSK